MQFSRRQLIIGSLCSVAYSAFAKPLTVNILKNLTNSPFEIKDCSPQIHVIGSTTEFTGDEINRPHEILWNKSKYLQENGGLPSPTQFASVVVVGGGVSGLTAAYKLKDLKPIILDQASRFGGNSKGEIINDTPFSIGAAYITIPDLESSAGQLLNELGILNDGKVETKNEVNVCLRNRVVHGFWNGESDPERAQEFIDFHNMLTKIYNEKYPQIPPAKVSDEESKQNRDYLNSLDQITFRDWLKNQTQTYFDSQTDAQSQTQLHPHIVEFLELYSWSSFAATTDELSAAQMLSFIAADVQGTVAFPGGNSYITKTLFEKLQQEIPSENIKSGAFVVDIRYHENNVHVTFVDEEKKMHCISCQACIVSSPKFVAERLIDELPDDQIQAIQSFRYRGYMVANVTLKRECPALGYEMYLLNNEIPENPTPLNPKNRFLTDLCFSHWPSQNNQETKKQPVLTYYKAFPYDGARQLLFNPASHEKYQNLFRKEILNTLESLGFHSEDIDTVRLTRWGHAIPLAERGILASGKLEKASQPYGKRVFFANQDNWMNPCFETAAAVAIEAAEEVRKII